MMLLFQRVSDGTGMATRAPGPGGRSAPGQGLENP